MDGRQLTSAACPADGTAFADAHPVDDAGASALAFFSRAPPTVTGASTAKIGSSAGAGLFTPASMPPTGATAVAVAIPVGGEPAASPTDATLQHLAAAPLPSAPDAAAQPGEQEPEEDPENDPVVRAEADQLIGTVLAERYHVDAMIGVGGMGIVFRATHVTIGRPMAIKCLRLRHAQRESVSKRFAQEAQLASRIKHPNVVDILDYGVTPTGAPYYVMEFLDGHSLAWEVDNRGRLAPHRAFDVAIQIAAGLGEAHVQGVVHRDLKPDNVFLCRSSDEGRDLVKLLDFGIARVAGRKTRLTAAGAVVGTPEYMSPEQAQGKDVDPRADLYSLGVMLFEMMTGQVPFRADTMVGTLTKQVFEAPPPLRQLEPSLPQLPNLERLLARLLAKNKDERPSTAAEVIAALKSAREGDLTATGAVAAPQQRPTVAIGSWGVGDQAPVQAAGAVENVPGRGPMLSPPRNAGWGGDVPVQKRPSVIVRDGTPSEFWPPRAQRTTRRGQRSVLPVVLLGSGAAVFAALLTVGLVRYVDRQGDAVAESPVPGPATIAEADSPPAREAEPEPAPAPARPPTPTLDPAPELAAATAVAADEEEKAGPRGPKPVKSKAKKAVAKAPATAPAATPPIQRPGGTQGTGTAKKPRDPPPPPSVSLGDLKDPFGAK